MSVTSGFFNSLNGDRKYNAEQMSAIFDGIINDGVFMSIGEAFAVKADTGYQVTVGIGRAWFNSTWIYNDAILPVLLEPSEVLLDRIDAVVIQVDRTDAVRKGDIQVVKGTPSSSPLRPSLVKTEKVNQYPLAYILRKAGSESITQGSITSMVGTSDCPFITGILEVMDIDNIVLQWGAQWDEWYDSQTAKNEAASQEMINQWNKWFSLETSINEEALDLWMADMKSDFLNWYQSLEIVLEEDTATSMAAAIVKLQQNFDTLLQDHSIYDTLEDNNGGIILDNMGFPIETKAVFSTSIDKDLDDLHLAFELHEKDFDNPHQVTTEQIGAAKEDHTHNYAGALSPGGAATSANQLNATVLTNQDLNTLRSATNFYYAAGGNSCGDKPSGVDNFGMFVMQVAGGWFTQMLYASDGELHMRHWNGNTWTGWKKVVSGTVTAADIANNSIGSDKINFNYAGSSSKGGAATSANKLATPRSMQVNLQSGRAVNFDGSGNVSLGVTGILPVSKGGIGSSNGISNYTFVDQNLNTVNIDATYGYNYTASISEKSGRGTFPSDSPGWVQIVNFEATHFAFQICQEISTGTSADRAANTWIRQRYAIDGSAAWSNWVRLYDSRKIKYSTTDLTAGSSNLGDGELYLVYE